MKTAPRQDHERGTGAHGEVHLSQVLASSLPPGKRSIDLFGGSSPVRYELSDSELVRTIERRGRKRDRQESMILEVPSPVLAAPDALWDFTELRRDTAPDWSIGSKPVRLVDMFSGMGAMSLGVAQACKALGHRCNFKAAFEIERSPLETYKANFAVEHAVNEDLSRLFEVDVDKRLQTSEKFWRNSLGDIDIVVAGPPCQGHSNLNNVTRRRDPKNELYILVARVAKVLRPRFIIVENVITVRNDKSKVMQRTREALEKRYWVDDGLVNLWRLGVPQTRRRHVLLAIRKDQAVRYVEDIVSAFEVRPRPLDWAIGDLPFASKEYLHTPNSAKPETQRRIEYLFEHDEYDLPDEERPPCHRTKKHSYQSVYGRLKWGELAPTITGGFDTMGRGRFIHPEYKRTLTPREALRLQTIPDYFDPSALVGSRRTLIETIGNAVPPLLSFVMALELLR